MQRSAGLLVWRPGADGPEVLLGHMGGPYWARKDAGAWTVPKGLVEDGESELEAARREFREETGLVVEGPAEPLAPCRASGKMISVWLVRAELDLRGFSPGLFEMKWPPRSGRRASFPEIDRVAYLGLEEAGRLIAKGQRPILEAAAAALAPQSQARR